MLYTVSQQFRFREERKSVPAGGVIDLDDDVAAQYMVTHPGLLKPVRQNAMAAPKVVRSKRNTTSKKKAPSKPKAQKPAEKAA